MDALRSLSVINSYKEWHKFKMSIYKVIEKEMKLKDLGEVMHDFGTHDMIMLRLGLGKEYCEISDVLGFDKSDAEILDCTKKANKLIQTVKRIVKTARGKRLLQNYLKQVPKYLSADEIIGYNRLIIEKIRVKKADKHEVLSKSKIIDIIDSSKNLKGGIYEKAVCLLKGLIKKHPFASANRRTAFFTAKMFLLKNCCDLRVKNDPKQVKFVKKIREEGISDSEIEHWLRYGYIKKFQRITKNLCQKNLKDLEGQIEEHRNLLEAIGRL